MAADRRAIRLAAAYRDRLDLHLEGLTVLTEAGTGPFLYSPLIAAAAGAAVVAIAPDSPYAAHAETRRRLEECFAAAGLDPRSLLVLPARDAIGPPIDLFLNLGFVRPVDSALLALASPDAVVSYMSEAWEFRPGDVDLEACAAAGIPVAGVNENFADFGVFDACGQLALKLLFEAGVEVAGCRIATIGGDRFGEVVGAALAANGAASVPLGDSRGLTGDLVESLDALVIASFSEEEDLLRGSGLDPGEIAVANPELKVVSLVGGYDRPGLEKAGIACYPRPATVAPRRMTRTLAHLGDAPVIALHSLGMKVGQLLYERKKRGVRFGRFEDLVQPLPTC